MTAPTIEVTGLNFKKFTQSNKICVLRVHAGDIFGFGQMAKMQFEKDHPGIVNFGHIKIKRISYRSRAIQEFIKIEMPKIGMNASTILPGFYLFKDGELKAYHPGTFEPNKADTQVQGIAALSGIFAGVIVGIAKKSTAKGFEVFLEAMEMPVVMKVSQFFWEILGSNNSSYAYQRQQSVYTQELLNAYRLLQVAPNATDAEVDKARKALLREHHPDKHPGNEAVKNKYCAELNNAYDLIKKYRATNN